MDQYRELADQIRRSECSPSVSVYILYVFIILALLIYDYRSTFADMYKKVTLKAMFFIVVVAVASSWFQMYLCENKENMMSSSVMTGTQLIFLGTMIALWYAIEGSDYQTIMYPGFNIDLSQTGIPIDVPTVRWASNGTNGTNVTTPINNGSVTTSHGGDTTRGRTTGNPSNGTNSPSVITPTSNNNPSGNLSNGTNSPSVITPTGNSNGNPTGNSNGTITGNGGRIRCVSQ